MNNLEWYAKNDTDYLGQIIKACAHSNCPDCPIYCDTGECVEWLEADHEVVNDLTSTGELDSREKLEADIRKACLAEEIIIYCPGHDSTESLPSHMARIVFSWLDRQAAITRAECNQERDSLIERLEGTEALLKIRGMERDSLSTKLANACEVDTRQSADYFAMKDEIDNLRKGMMKLTAERDEWKSKCSNAERDRDDYRNGYKFVTAENEKLESKHQAGIVKYRDMAMRFSCALLNTARETGDDKILADEDRCDRSCFLCGGPSTRFCAAVEKVVGEWRPDGDVKVEWNLNEDRYEL